MPLSPHTRRHQQSHVIGLKDAPVDRLEDEDALEHAAVDERHAKKRAVGIFARFAEVLEPGMPRRIGDDLRPELLGDEADEAFVEAHADTADALGTKADGGRQNERGAVRFEQVDRADVGRETPLNQMNDVRQRFRRVAALRRETADFLERPEQRSFM